MPKVCGWYGREWETRMPRHMPPPIGGMGAQPPPRRMASGVCCAAGSRSENTAKMRPESEMSLVSTAMPECFVNACTMGKSEYVASAGASSVWV